VRRSEEELPDPQIYDAFLTSDEAGNLFLHGAVNHTYPFEMAYLPPILLVSVPLELGQYWVTEGVQAYDFDGVPIGVPFDYALQVDFEGNVAVPAGTFYAYGIGAVIPGQPNLPHEQNHDIFGRYIPFEEDARDIDITHWYTDQVGLVQRTFYLGDERVLKLLWWTPPTATEERTWGQIKGMYR